jgi:dihydropyrimidinase
MMELLLRVIVSLRRAKKDPKEGVVYDRVIKGGTLVTSGGVFPSDLAIQGERIAAVGVDLDGHEEIDARGLLVLPGGVDPHVHLEMPTATTRTSEDWTSGTQAAAWGGTTTVVDFIEPENGQGLIDALHARCMQADGQAGGRLQPAYDPDPGQ